MRINKYIGFQWLILIINPVFGFIAAVYFLLKNKHSILVISFSLSIIFIYLPLMYDTSSNFYATMQLYNFNIQNYISIRLYNLIPYYLYNILDIQFMLIILIYTTIILYIWFYIFKYYATFRINNKQLLYMMVFVFSSIIYRNIMDLNRFYFATSLVLIMIFILEIKMKEFESKYIVYLFGVIAFLMHPATAILLLFYFIAKSITKKSFFTGFPIVLFFFGLIAGPFSRYMLNLPMFNSINFLMAARGYVEYGTTWAEHSVQGYELVLRIIELVLIFLLYYKSILLLKTSNKKILIRYTLLLMGFVLFLLSFKSLYERYSIAYFLFSLFIVYESILYKKKQDFILITILIVFVLRFILVNIVWYGIIFTPKYNAVLPNHDKKMLMVAKPFYFPTPFIMDIKNYGYSNNYIREESTRGRKYLQLHRDSPLLEKQGS